MSILRASPKSGAYSKFGINLFESHHAPNFFMDWNIATELIIFYILNGEGTLWTRENKHPLKKGSVVVVPKAVQYRIVDSFGKPLSLYYLGSKNSQYEEFSNELNIHCVRVIKHKPTCLIIRTSLQDMLYEQMTRSPGFEIKLFSLFLEVITVLLRRWSEYSDAITPHPPANMSLSRARVTAYIQEMENYSHRQQNMAQAAANTGLHVRRFSLLFQEITGMQWLQFLHQKRVEYAKRLLRETDSPIIFVCFECGFDDITSFYRTFRKLEKATPSAWRKGQKEKPNSKTAK